MSVQSVALASLTATYTDSEGDEGLDDDHHHHHHHHHHHQQQQQQHDDRDDDLENQQHRDSSNAATPQLDESQNSNVGSNQRMDSLLFGRCSSTNSPDEDEDNPVRGNDSYPLGNNRSMINKYSHNAPTLVTDVTSKVQRLVSYFDDTVVSDDETGTATAFDDKNDKSNTNNRTTITTSCSSSSSSGSSLMRKTNNAATQSPKRQGELVSDLDEDDWGIAIPPEPSGTCPPELQEKISKLYKKMESGLDMNAHIQQRKEFRNPSIYEKLIQFCSINEMGTNYPPERFDPFKWGKDSYYEELARIQKNEMDKLEKARKEKTKIEIVTGTAKRPNANPTNPEDDAKRRKSKWDQVATGTNSSVKSNLVMSQPTLTTLTSSATGTKATVISAFGSLPKKRL